MNQLEEIQKRFNDMMGTREGTEEWRHEVFSDTWRDPDNPHVEVHYVEFGPKDDKSDCYDMFEDPTPETVEFLAHSKKDIEFLIKELLEAKENVRFWINEAERLASGEDVPF